MFGKMKELMEMKKHADKIKKELDASSVDVEEVRGINISINGSQKFKSITIDPSFLREDNKERLEKDFLRSVNAAVKKSQQIAAQKMQSVLPGMPGM